MNEHEAYTAEKVWKQIQIDVGQFYKSVIPIEKRTLFKDLARKHEPELYASLEKRKKQILLFEDDIQRYCLNMRAYKHESIKMIRLISYRMLSDIAKA